MSKNPLSNNVSPTPLLVGIGYDSASNQNFIETVDPLTGSVTPVVSFQFDTGAFGSTSFTASQTDAFVVSSSGMLYDIDVATAAISTASDAHLDAYHLGAMVYNGATLVAIGYDSTNNINNIETIDPATGHATPIASFRFDTGGYYPTDFAASSTDAYVMSSSGLLYDINLFTGAVATAATDSSLGSLAYSGQALVGIGSDVTNTSLHVETIDPTTGHTTPIASFKLASGYLNDASFSASPTDAYAVSTSGLVYDIDLSAGSVASNFSVASNIDYLKVGTVEENALCFLPGMLIATPNGETPVEQLSVGDSVVTVTGQVRPIVWIGKGRALAPAGRRSAATPVIVRKGALAEDMPHRDLHVTKGHALFFDGVLIPVEFLVNHHSIQWDDRGQEVTVYHLELDAHDVLLANGAPAESYRDDGNRWLFHNAESVAALSAKPAYAPVMTGGPIVDAIWRRLLDRARPERHEVLTDDPDLHLLVDGARIDALERRDNLYVFRLTRRPWTSARVRSRAVVPQQVGLARDPRRLGVAIQRIVIATAGTVRALLASELAATDGFHACEPEAGLRWTDGDASLPLSLFETIDRPTLLMLHLGARTQYLTHTGTASTAA